MSAFLKQSFFRCRVFSLRHQMVSNSITPASVAGSSRQNFLLQQFAFINVSFPTLEKAKTEEQPLKEVPVVDYDVVNKIVSDRKIFLIDVRKPEEILEKGFIPTAVNLPVDDVDLALTLDESTFKARYGFSKPSTSDKIILFCRSGVRANRAGNVFYQHNYADVMNFKGSWLKWIEQHPEDDRAQPVKSE